jgi:hypothetical protein
MVLLVNVVIGMHVLGIKRSPIAMLAVRGEKTWNETTLGQRGLAVA